MSAIWPQLPSAPPLPREEERAMLRDFQAGDRLCGDRIIRSNTRFIVRQSARHRTAHQLLPDDAVQQGLLGFHRAMEKFDLERSTSLRTYGNLWIRAFVKQAELDLDDLRWWKTQRMRNLRIAVFRRSRALCVPAWGLFELRKEVVALAEAYDFSVSFIEDLRAAFLPSSRLGHPVGNTEDLLLDLPDRSTLTPETALDLKGRTQRLQDAVERALGEIPDRESDILRWRYLAEDKLTLQECGERLGISRERVRQLEAQAIRRIQRAGSLDGFAEAA